MILALDVGNSQIFGGVFESNKMRLSFRRNSKQGSSSDEIGVFLRTVLVENELDPASIKNIVISTVVPDLLYSLRGACTKYFNVKPFVLQAGVKTGLKIKYRNPLEVGSDRIANAIGATFLFPDRDIIIVDLGTATKFCAINREKEFLGGAIAAGLRLCMESLESKTAKLPSVEIVIPDHALGRSTIENIQSGLYFGHLGMIKELSQRLAEEGFKGHKPYIIGTGGFSHLFENENLFDVILPDLVLKGLLVALQINS